MLSNAFSLLFAEQILRKYQEESTKVSKVSVSLVHNLPSILTFFQVVWESNGLPLVFRSMESGSLTGKSFFGILITLLSSS